VPLNRIYIEFGGEVQVNRRLDRFKDSLEDPRPLWENLFGYLERAETQQFNAQGKAAKWKPLAESTVAYKKRHGLDRRILHATLAMRKSLTQRGHGDAVRISTLDFMQFGTDVEYAGIHQKGGGRVPQRRVIDLTETQRREIVKRTQKFLLKGTV
jgi:phage gpG-like protein